MPHSVLKTDTGRHLALIGAACVCCAVLWLTTDFVLAQETPPVPETVTITSLGMGPPQIDVVPAIDAAPATFTAVDDARRRSIVLFLIETLGIAEYNRLERGIESLILSDYEGYIIDSTTLTEDRIPLSSDVIVSVRATLDAAALLSYTENIALLAPPPEDIGGPSEDEMDAFAALAEEMLLQADVATDVLLDPVQGIESYEEAMALFESARYDGGVYTCLMGIGRAKTSLGYPAEAASAFDRAGDLARSLDSARGEAAARLERARLLFLTGDYASASEDISVLLEDIRGTGFDDIEARGLETSAYTDFALGRRERATDEIVRAISLYEGLSDRKSHYAAYVSYGLMLLSAGEYDAAVEKLKLAKIMSERMEDDERRIVVLTALGSAISSLGDSEGARLYLDEAITTAGNTGWEYGEARALIERAKLSAAIGDVSRAAGDEARAEGLARTLDAPALLAASLFVRGRIFELQGDRAGALDAYLEAAAKASDIRTAAAGEAFSPFTIDDMRACVEAALILAAGMNDAKGAAEAVSSYHTALICRYLFIETPRDFTLPVNDSVSIPEWKAIVGRTLGVEAVWRDPSANALSSVSLDALTQRREETLDAFFESASTIQRQAPMLALLSGIEHPNYSSMRQLLGAAGAHVQYFIGPSRAFALVVTAGGVEIVSLPTGSADIIEATEDLLAAMEGTTAAPPAITLEETPEGEAPADTAETEPEGEDARILVPDVLTLDEAARRAAALLIAPVSSHVAFSDAIGINPGPDLPTPALAAMTDGSGFLPESASVFYCPAVTRRYFPPDLTLPTFTYLILMERGLIDVRTHEELFYDTYIIDSLAGGLMMLPDETLSDSDFVLAINDVTEIPVIAHPAALTVFADPPGDDPVSRFSLFELFFAAGPQRGVIILTGADPDAANAFFRELVCGVREYGMPKGFEKAARSDTGSGTAASAYYLLFGDY